MPLNIVSPGVSGTPTHSRERVPPAASALVPASSDRVRLRIDPQWLYWKAWDAQTQNPIGDTLRFYFIDLEGGLQESAAVNYADADIVGRAEAYKTYVGNANRELAITFQFQVQGLEAGTLQSAIENEVVNPVKWLDSLKFPYVDEIGISHAPPPCFLEIGRLFKGRVLATEVQITWKQPFDPDTMLPYAAEVQTTFTVVRRFVENYRFKPTSAR